MRAKKAKALRRIARENAGTNAPERRYLLNQQTGQIINDPKSVRGIYRQLKKHLNSAQVQS